MRWYVVALSIGVLAFADACKGTTTTGSQGIGQLLFQKDTTCTDTTNTELFVDGSSQGQITMRPGSAVGFNVTASTHTADAIERAGKLRDFGVQAINVPLAASATYTMTCGGGAPPPPNSPPGR